MLKESENTFYVLAHAVSLQFLSNDPEQQSLDILELEEGEFVDGLWTRGRRFNGDEAVMNSYMEPMLLRVKLFAYD